MYLLAKLFALVLFSASLANRIAATSPIRWRLLLQQQLCPRTNGVLSNLLPPNRAGYYHLFEDAIR